MANPTLNEKRFEAIQKDDEAGWAAPVELAHAEATGAPPTTRVAHMTANGAFARTFALFLLVIAGGVVGWSQTEISSTTNQVSIPGWSWIALFGAFASGHGLHLPAEGGTHPGSALRARPRASSSA